MGGGQARVCNLLGGLAHGRHNRLGDHWLTRLTWNRTMTGYDRDTDVILAGIGYRF